MAGVEQKVFYEILDSCGVPKDAVLIIHSAFKGLSEAGFRVESTIESFIDYLNNGTLLMPTMSWRNVTPENPFFDELATSSQTGILTEIFRKKYATHRSLHPTHSVAGFGVLSKYLLSTHHLSNTPVSSSSPYGLMRDYNAYIMFLGIGFEMCTAIHHAEEVIAPEIYVKSPSEAESYELRSRDGRAISYQLRRHNRLNRNFPKYEIPLLQSKQLCCGTIAGINWKLIRASDLYCEVFQSLVISPGATIG
jgi:aminoglycoside 3-N-acetyltransferase